MGKTTINKEKAGYNTGLYEPLRGLEPPTRLVMFRMTRLLFRCEAEWKQITFNKEKAGYITGLYEPLRGLEPPTRLVILSKSCGP
ncbi:MAG: hypothetical protein K0B15_08275 [Lentimicrobium sp.]|nr:hypothetical protein [Lentimicrobium sp.]